MKTNIKLISRVEIQKELAGIDTDLLLVVIDSKVNQIHGKTIEMALPKDKQCIVFKCVEGESTKCFEEFENGIEFFLEKGIHRKAHLVAIGGGATSDYAGYIASSLLRGISWSIIPTTLLSMVDASIGGKTGLNSKHGKNLLGAFHMPDNVWIEKSFLASLPKDELRSGIGEVIKYGFLDKEVLEFIESGYDLEDIIKACADCKERIVQEDFKEMGSRMSLNLGHTFGHALERIYDLSHGEAVFWGMALIFKLFQAAPQSYLQLLRRLSVRLNVDFGEPPWLNKTFPIEKIMDYLNKDKKKSSVGSVKIIKLKELGEFEAQTVEISKIKELLEEKKNELRSFSL